MARMLSGAMQPNRMALEETYKSIERCVANLQVLLKAAEEGA